MSPAHARPVDIPTRQTCDFVSSNTVPGSRIFEIGCGDGQVAHELDRLGYNVIAIDSDPEAIEKARALGVDAELASWPQDISDPVDATLFSRSLHHLHELDASVSAAHRALEPSGLILVEDFAFNSADAATINWFVGVLKSEAAKSMLRPESDEFVTSLLGSEDPIAAWDENHDADLPTFEAMREAIAAVFEIRTVEEVPYLYRYLISVVADSSDAADWVNNVYNDEAVLGTNRDIVLVGRRIVATVRAAT